MTSTALVAKQGGLVFAGPVGSLDSYIDRVSQIPVLTKDNEVALAVRFRAEGDLDAARQLVLSHEFGALLHLSYSGSDERIFRKISTWGHRHEVGQAWFVSESSTEGEPTGIP